MDGRQPGSGKRSVKAMKTDMIVIAVPLLVVLMGCSRHSPMDMERLAYTAPVATSVVLNVFTGTDTARHEEPASEVDAEGRESVSWDAETLVDSFATGDIHERPAAWTRFDDERARLVSDLIAILTEPVVEGETWFWLSPRRNAAARILGNLRAEEAAEYLVECLYPHKGQTGTGSQDYKTAYCVGCFTLTKIGAPAKKHLIEAIAKGCRPKTPRDGGAEWTFKRELGTTLAIIAKDEGGVEAVIGRAIEAETDEKQRANQGVNLLLTWNCRHINNAETKPLMRSICAVAGYKCPEICTPQELLPEDTNEIPG